MKIVTWNALRTNTSIITGVKTLLKNGHDVICLQEIPSTDKKFLEGFVPYSASVEECIWPVGISYNMILSKHPIVKLENVPHKEWSSLNSRSRNRRNAMFFQKADILKGGTSWRIINTHLVLNAPPRIRIKEWIRMHRHMAAHNNSLMCGDFNTFASPWWSILTAWTMDYHRKDIFTHERKKMKEFIQKKGLVNPFTQRTQMHLPYQLDFILFRKELEFNNAHRWPERYGSDHWPLSIEFK